jgi:hypothetical protein
VQRHERWREKLKEVAGTRVHPERMLPDTGGAIYDGARSKKRATPAFGSPSDE